MIILITTLPSFESNGETVSPLVVSANECNCSETDPVAFGKNHGISGKQFTVLELPIDPLAGEMLGTDRLYFMGARTGRGLGVSIGHSRIYGDVLVCRKLNGRFCAFKKCASIPAIINYYLDMSFQMSSEFADPVNMEPDVNIAEMIKKETQ